MNFKITNKLLLKSLLLIFFINSCSTLDNIYKKENEDKQISINEQIEFLDKLKEKNINNEKNIQDFYSDNFSLNFDINDKFTKKLSINNYRSQYKGLIPLKVYIIDNFIYGINHDSVFNIYKLDDGKLIQSVKLENEKDKIITSFTMYNKNFIIGYKSGEIINIDINGKILWKIKYDNILSTPIKIINKNIIVLFGDTIKSISIDNGKENWSETYEGEKILLSKGGIINEFVNLIYFILPNSSVGQFDTLSGEKNISNFTNFNFENSINYPNHKLHIFDHYITYFNGQNRFSTYDIFSNKYILTDHEISEINTFKFYNNSLIVKKDNNLKSYNLKNGKLFWNFNIDKIINEKSNIIEVKSFDKNIYIFFNTGKILIIKDTNIINKVDLKTKNINLLYFYDDHLLASTENGKTIIY